MIDARDALVDAVYDLWDKDFAYTERPDELNRQLRDRAMLRAFEVMHSIRDDGTRPS